MRVSHSMYGVAHGRARRWEHQNASPLRKTACPTSRRVRQRVKRTLNSCGGDFHASGRTSDASRLCCGHYHAVTVADAVNRLAQTTERGTSALPERVSQSSATHLRRTSNRVSAAAKSVLDCLHFTVDRPFERCLDEHCCPGALETTTPPPAVSGSAFCALLCSPILCSPVHPCLTS